MRGIKFRGKRLTDGIVCNPLASPSDYEVNPDTVGQFTGLCDCNGKVT